MKLLGNMIKQVSGLTASDLNAWEKSFVDSVVEKSACGQNTTTLSPKQVEVIERLFDKHFAG